jgi:hypothetical protein
MKSSSLTWLPSNRAALASLAALLAVVCLSSFVQAQQKMSKRYPAGKNVRIELKNISGTIVVESWNKDEIRLSATMESSNAHVVPRQIDESLVVDVMSDNRGRGDVGDINFRLQVPANSSVDLETRRGQISVLNLRGSSVRAHVSTEGDIELTNITASQVVAQNTIGNIFFDGEFSNWRHLRIQIDKGRHNDSHSRELSVSTCCRISAKRIALGDFWNNGFKTRTEENMLVTLVMGARQFQ